MSFLTPLYIAGLAAVSLPVLFHLIRRRPRGRVAFSTLMFLQPSPPRITRRSRLDNWPLLLLRALAVCLLAAAFARPFLREAAGVGAQSHDGKVIAILLDTSASMRRGELWQRAIRRARRHIENAGREDRIGLYAFDRKLRAIVGLDEWSSLTAGGRKDLARRRLSGVEPGWAATDLGTALTAAAEMLNAVDGGREHVRQVVLISDLQRGSRLAALETYQWPSTVQLRVEPIRSKRTTNAGLYLMNASSIEGTGGDEFIRIRVSNAADSSRDQFRVRCVPLLDGPSADGTNLVDRSGRASIAARSNRGDTRDDGAGLDVYVPAGTSRTFRVPVDESLALPARLILEGDDHDFDNRAVFDRPVTEALTVVFFGDDDADNPEGLRYFVERAFPEDRLRKVQVVGQKADSPLIRPLSREIPLAIVARTPDAGHAGSIRRYCRQGGTVLFVGAEPGVCRAFGRLAGLDRLQIDEAEVDGYAMLGQIDFEHPVFAPFADGRYSDFTHVHFWRHRVLDERQLEGCRILARFDNGDPLLVSAEIDDGTALLLTSGWHPEDSQLALSTKFVPLVNAMLELNAGRGDVDHRYAVGDAVPLAEVMPLSQSPATVVAPQDRVIELASGQQSFDETVVPGLYTIEGRRPRADSRGRDESIKKTLNTQHSTLNDSGRESRGLGQTGRNRTQRFAVHLAPEESLTSPLTPETLEAHGVRTVTAQAAVEQTAQQKRKRQMKALELENRLKLWRWLIVAALGTLVIETWLAGRSQPSRTPQ